MQTTRFGLRGGAIVLLSTLVFSAGAAAKNCEALPDYRTLTDALRQVAPDAEVNGGLDTHMWASIVDRDGRVCVLTRSGAERDDQWPGSRVIAAQKANTANAFSLDTATFTGEGLALSTANLYSGVQPGGSLFGLQTGNPVDTSAAYGRAGPGGPMHRGFGRKMPDGAKAYGTAKDPLRGRFVGGVNVFGGGLALYDSNGEIIGALGVSGDTSCADHNIAWRVRDRLGLDYLPAGVGPDNTDNIIYDTQTDPATGHTVSDSGFGHPECGFGEAAANEAIVEACPAGDGATEGCL